MFTCIETESQPADTELWPFAATGSKGVGVWGTKKKKYP